jgi:hypothetical protein
MDNLCPKCNSLLRVNASKYVIRDGKLYMVQDLVCRNDKCENNGKVVKTIEHELKVSE